MTPELYAPRCGMADGALRELAWTDRSASPNPGLFFDRFLGLPVEKRKPKKEDGRAGDAREAIDAFVERFRHVRADAAPRLDDWHRRMDSIGSAAGARGARVHHVYGDAVLQSPLVAGGGSKHPLENALGFHHTLGVPYLPGSSLKGIARSWAETTGRGEKLRRRFGVGPDAGRSSAGEWVFLDGLPVSGWPVLGIDIVNVHLREYYGNRAGEGGNPDALPVESPVPVFLPVVEAPLTFRFRVGTQDGDGAVAREGLALLLEGLEWLGAGAKTAVGYGSFSAVSGSRP